MICTFYAHETGFERIRDILAAGFPKAKLSVGKEGESDWITVEQPGFLLKKGSVLTIRYRQRADPFSPVTINDDSALANNFRGLYNFVAGLPCHNEEVKQLLLAKITTLNCEFSLSLDRGEAKGLREMIAYLADSFDAVLFVQPGTVISRAKAQHFLDKHLDLLLDQEGNCDVAALEVQVNASFSDGQRALITPDQTDRKERNEAFLVSRNIKVNKYLPCIESEAATTIRSAHAVAERVTALAVTNLVATNQFTGEEAIHYLDQYQLSSLMTPKEKAFLANPSDQQKVQETWKCEGIYVLLWAMGKVDELPFPDALCNLSNISPVDYPVIPGRDPVGYIQAIDTIRSKHEIMNANDLYYRFYWTCVDARLNGRDAGDLIGSVVYERLYALNWLIGYLDLAWDDVSCDT